MTIERGKIMVRLYENGAYLIKNTVLVDDINAVNLEDINHKLIKAGQEPILGEALYLEIAKKNTMAYSILEAHNTSCDMDYLKMKFDALASHDITYVGIVQTAKASGLETFPLPYVLTNCHNSLCSVGGTINEDDHVFGLSAAKKYGGIYVPAHQAVIHQYMREMMAGCGKMILGSDSHTRYGALGTMAIGEGGPELVKQLLNRTYDVKYPDVVAVYLEGKPQLGVGPQDVALTIIEKVFKNGFVKNKVMEFVGPGIANLTVDYRNGIDVMTTETTCLSSIWSTDAQVEDYLAIHDRKADYKKLEPKDVAYYDGLIRVDLSTIEPVIALPFHPSNVFSIKELNTNAKEIFAQVEADARKIFGNNKINFSLTEKLIGGRIRVDQGIVAGCSGGTYENIYLMGDMIDGHSTGSDDFVLNVYPASQPIFYALNQNGAINKLMEAGANIKTAFCGPCFGAGDVPSNNALSIRHTTRNFPNREGSKPSDGQISSVALMDARSITATAINGGFLTPATELNMPISVAPYSYNSKIYDHRIYQGYTQAETDLALKFGPNIKEWPDMTELTDNLLLKVASVIKDPVTTTDELIPSGETSSYRSNPHRLAEFTLSRKDPEYVGRSKKINALEKTRVASIDGDCDCESKNCVCDTSALKEVFNVIESEGSTEKLMQTTALGSIIYANKPGDGSAREQAASCQKVLGGWGNIATEYATKRYRSNLINWGLLPFITKEEDIDLMVDDYIFIPGIKDVVENNKEEIEAVVIRNGQKSSLKLYLPELATSEREILLAGCLINYYKAH